MSELSFKELQKLWYKKLEDTGFFDIEAKETTFRSHRYGRGKRHGQYSNTWQDSKRYYYDLATSFLNEHEFESPLERVIWEYHANSISTRNIAKILIAAKVKTNRTTVWLTVKMLRQKMKEKYIK